VISSMNNRIPGPCMVASAQPFEDGLVVTTPDGSVCALNAAGRSLWEALQVGCTLEELTAASVRASDLAADVARARITDALRSWRELGFFDHPSALDVSDRVAVERFDPEPGRQPALDARYLVGDRPVRMRCDDVSLGKLIDAACGALRLTAADDVTATVHLIERDGRFAVRAEDAILTREPCPTDNPASARHRCLTGLLEVARHRRRWLGILHASVVADRGRCVILSGQSGSGKSTLAAGAVAAGASFVSDDYAPLERGSWLVWPVPYAPSIKRGSWEALSRAYPDLANAPVHQLGGLELRYLELAEARRVPLDQGLPVRLLVFPQYRENADFTLHRLTPTEALTELCVARPLLDRQSDVLAELLRWVESVPAYRVVYDDFGAAVERTLVLLSRA
jgi:hypothetical protein